MSDATIHVSIALAGVATLMTVTLPLAEFDRLRSDLRGPEAIAEYQTTAGPLTLRLAAVQALHAGVSNAIPAALVAPLAALPEPDE